MSWQADLGQAARESAERRGRMRPWWVEFEGHVSEMWATTRESGEGWTLCAVARTLYSMRRTFEVVRSTDEGTVLVRAHLPLGYLAVEESDMDRVMRSVRLTGLHGTYRKAGTERKYRF